MTVVAPTVSVFVTGFGPFPDGKGGQFDRNTSHLIASLLPASLPAGSALNPTPAHINIINPTAADGAYVKAEYAYIRQYCKELHNKHGRDIDLLVHIGQAAGWNFVSVERVAFGQDMSTSWFSARDRTAYYMIPDNAGKTIADAGANPWRDLPLGLSSALDVDAVVSGAQSILITRRTFDREWNDSQSVAGPAGQPTPEGGSRRQSATHERSPITVRAHNEGGPYCCGFIHYESLANYYVNDRTPNVLFCHVPGESDRVSLEKGRDAICAIIVSGVNQVLEQRTRGVSAAAEKSAVHP